MKTYELVVYPEKCHGCGNCVVACPVNAKHPETRGGKGPYSDDVVIRVENGVVTIVNQDLCGGCGACIEACPVNAIELVFKRK
jgi:4Fe-4S ferredoxin